MTSCTFRNRRLCFVFAVTWATLLLNVAQVAYADWLIKSYSLTHSITGYAGAVAADAVYHLS